ncbi:MAG: response regulator [Nitrospirales bacterium]
MLEKVLFVDDEMSVLDALKRQLHQQFHLDVALGAQEAITIIRNRGPYAVVISDCKMPVMDGIQFLSLVRKFAPNTVRMMLTGNNDLETAMEAVNQGEIFRFLTKPCPPATLQKALQAGVEQYQLNRSKKTP